MGLQLTENPMYYVLLGRRMNTIDKPSDGGYEVMYTTYSQDKTLEFLHTLPVANVYNTHNGKCKVVRMIELNGSTSDYYDMKVVHTRCAGEESHYYYDSQTSKLIQTR